jgi:adenylate cyclase
LTALMNSFLTPLTNAIIDRKGTIDKYMGDAIMAFWNAPVAVEHHAARACDTALAMQARLRQLNAEWKAEAEAAGRGYIPVNIGIGLNTGQASVGNFGSVQRFTYSCLSDDVNLASRLEGRSKVYGVQIVMGENTVQRLPAGLAVIEIDRVKVKGKARPVTIFTLLGDAAVAAEPWFVQVAELHTTMLAAYRAQDWSAATAAILRARAAAAGRLDGLYDLYRERIAAFREKPPPEDWDGVEIATEK